VLVSREGDAFPSRVMKSSGEAWSSFHCLAKELI